MPLYKMNEYHLINLKNINNDKFKSYTHVYITIGIIASSNLFHVNL